VIEALKKVTAISSGPDILVQIHKHLDDNTSSRFYMLDSKSIAELPKKIQLMMATTAPPVGRMETKGPSQFGGRTRAVSFAAGVRLEVALQEEEYAYKKA
jgi:hypothetical protein